MSAGEQLPLLAVRGLGVAYGSGRHARQAVHDVGFDLRPGESLGLVGESGSGKTSIARAILRLVPATGSVRFNGQELLGLDARALRPVRSQVQVIFQDPLAALDPRMRLGESIGEPLREFQPGMTRDDQRDAVLGMMARVGLGAALHDRYPHEISGGQAQRAGIARALLARPRLLVCDEPVASLDVSIKSQVGNLLRELQQELGLALLYISHDLATVRHACDRILVLYRGRVVEQSPCATFFAGPRHPYARALLASVPVPDPGRPPVAAPAVAAPPPQGRTRPGHGLFAHEAGDACPFLPRCALAAPECAREIPLLRPIGTGHVACHLAREEP